MNRRYIPASAFLLTLALFAAGPVIAFVVAAGPEFTPEQLVENRDIPMSCANGVCTIKESDVRWITARDNLLVRIVDFMEQKMKGCVPQRGA